MNLYDVHLLYIYTNNLEERQIAKAFARGIRKYEEESGDTIRSCFRINMVRNITNELLGYAWIYITDPKLYHLLVGNNADGTERIQVKEEPSKHAPAEPFEKYLEREIKNANISEGSWGREAEIEQIRHRVKRLYEPNRIEIKLPPLIQPIMAKGQEPITISRAKLNYPEAKFNSGQLKNTEFTTIEPWMDRDLLYDLFRPYVSNQADFNYPKIRVNDKGAHITVFVEYEPGTTDFIVALNMVKKIYLRDPNGDPVLLTFNFSKKRY